MVKWLRVLLVGVAIMAANAAISQSTTDSQLAAHYYQSGEYDKAAMYYKRLYDKDHSLFHYNYYLKCLFKTQDFETAEKLVKFHSRLNPNNYRVKVDLGIVYQKQGKIKQADKEFNKLIDRVVPSFESVNGLALAFIEIEDYSRALSTYKKGESLMKGGYPFNVEKAEVYAYMKDWPNMVDELLELLSLNPGYLSSIQNALSKNANFEKDSEPNQILKSRLIKLINQNPNNDTYSELLLWLYQQEGNWKGALIQTKALDRRRDAGGQMVYSLAETMINNEIYDPCIEACEYVIDLGKDEPYFIDAKVLLLEARHRKVTESGDYSMEDINSLITDYDNALIELGKNSSTVVLLHDKATILSFYKHELDSGLNTFEEALEVPGVPEPERARIKLDYGDALLAAGYVWDASLTYGQVDKQFKYDRLGEIAKLKSSEVSFYTGDFALAKARLDILKGSTSKLIANDAMRLSILITDNSTVDTSTHPLQLYADASLLLIQNKVDEAVLKLDSIGDQYPGHALDDDILYLRYEIDFKRKNYKKAAEYLESIISAYSYDLLADKAIFKLAELNQYKFDDKEKAMELYQVILLDYKDSLFATEARKRYRLLRGDQIN